MEVQTYTSVLSAINFTVRTWPSGCYSIEEEVIEFHNNQQKQVAIAFLLNSKLLSNQFHFPQSHKKVSFEQNISHIQALSQRMHYLCQVRKQCLPHDDLQTDLGYVQVKE